MMDRLLEGKVAIVTGAAGGIGAAIAEAYARHGATVIVADRGDAGDIAARIRERGDKADALALDVADRQSVDGLVSSVLDRHGRIDILVNAAGVFDATSIDAITHADWQRVFDVNVFGLAAMSQAVTPTMIAQGAGRIVNIASIGGRRADEKTAVYSASKAAVISITQSTALALVKSGVIVNAIAPGPVRTQLWENLDKLFSARYLQAGPGAFTKLAEAAIPAGALAEPAQIAEVAVFLASPASAFVVGQTLNVDGGVMLS